MLSCAFFFSGPGMIYGLFTSRLPAITDKTGAQPKDVGLILLAVGLASLVSLFTSPYIIRRLSSRVILPSVMPLALLTLPLLAMCTHVWQLMLAAIPYGFLLALLDASINTQGIIIEQKYGRRCMSSLHAFYGIGGIAAAGLASAFAHFSQGPMVNFVSVIICYALFIPLATKNLVPDREIVPEGHDAVRRGRLTGLPFMVYLCGFITLCAYIVEGSVGEWGSIYMYNNKHAPESVAALVYGTFYVTSVVVRLFADRLTERLKDYVICCVGAMLGGFAMTMIIQIDNTTACLIFYALLGVGMAPIVPLMFSRAGSLPDVNPADASAVVAIFGYSGLLLYPPFLGYVAQWTGLDQALQIIVVLCLVLVFTSVMLKRGRC